MVWMLQSTIQEFFSETTRQPRYETIRALEFALNDGFGGCIGGRCQVYFAEIDDTLEFYFGEKA